MGVPGLYLDTRERGPVPIGSVLRADFHPDSDIDILVTFAPGQRLTLDHWLKIWEEIETLFDRKVDLVSKEYLKNPYRRHEILNTCQVIYAISRYCFGLGYGAIHSTNSRVKPRWPSNTHPLGRPPVDPAYASDDKRGMHPRQNASAHQTVIGDRPPHTSAPPGESYTDHRPPEPPLSVAVESPQPTPAGHNPPVHQSGGQYAPWPRLRRWAGPAPASR